MKNEWQKVYSNKDRYVVELKASILEQNNIESFIMSKKDSMIPVVGSVELHVAAENIEKAKQIIEKSNE